MQIIVLGPHRSGTSMVTRLINLMGAYFGAEGAQIGAGDENPKGFWERQDVLDLNNGLLASAGADWHQIGGFEAASVPQQARQRFDRKAARILLDLDAHRPWVLKEPRLCLLFPFWRPHLEAPVCILMHRSPIQVAHSLHRRNGFPLSLGIALWERYTLEALSASTGCPRVVVSYSDLIADPVARVEKLYQELTEFGVSGLRIPDPREIRAFVDPNLHHQHQDLEEHRDLVNDAQVELSRSLQDGTALLGSDGMPALSRSTRELLDLYQVHRERDEELARVREDHNNGRYEMNALREESQRRKEDLEAVRDEFAATRDELTSTRDELASIRDEFASTRDELASTHDELASTHDEITPIRDELTSAHDELTSIRDELTSARKELTSARKEFISTRDELTSTRSALKEKAAFLETVQTELAFRLAEFAEFRRALPFEGNLEHLANQIRDLKEHRDLQFRELEKESYRTLSVLKDYESSRSGRMAHFLSRCYWFVVTLGGLRDPSASNPTKKPSRKAALEAFSATDVEIVVCVHNALDDVRRCLDSVAKHTAGGYKLILVNDGSDEETSRYLNGFAGRHPRTQQLITEQPSGYTRAANRGLVASSAEIVVLLNSDTIVTPNWLEGLLECFQSSAQIGIVGPLSNNATYQSVPERYGPDGDWAINQLPPALGPSGMARLLAEVSERRFPRVNFVNGFCLALRRSVIDAIGHFDEESFPQGYGEENDYCLRAALAGFELAIADQTYVYHEGSKSYSHPKRLALVDKAHKALVSKHDQGEIDRKLSEMHGNSDLAVLRERLSHRFEEAAWLDKGAA